MNVKVILVTGEGGDAQGWGNMHVTEEVCASIKRNGHDCEIVCAETPDELEQGLAKAGRGLVWSALYFFSGKSEIIGNSDNAVWIADLLDNWGIPYIGPSSAVMKSLISKYDTHEILTKAGVSVPRHTICPPSTASDIDYFPAFVKPNGESRSIGISDRSVAENMAQLTAQIDYINKELGQGALVEEYLPGREYTVLVIGNGRHQEILPGRVTVAEEHYGKYHILRSDLRGVGLTKVSIPEEHYDEAVALADAACKALGCKDHIRIDMREDAASHLRIMEVNGIPGLKPVKSWSPQIFSLYHPGPDSYDRLIGTIIAAAAESLDA